MTDNLSPRAQTTDGASVEIAYALISSLLLAVAVGAALAVLDTALGWQALDRVGEPLLLALALGRALWLVLRFDLQRRADRRAAPGE